MKRVKLSILAIIGLAFMLLVIQNTDPVQARFLWLAAEIPVVVLLFLTAAGGFVAGLLVAMLVKRGSKTRPENSSAR